MVIANLAEIVWDKQTLTVAGAFGVPIVAFISYAWFHANKARSENALKRAMVERGMSAEEIERVIAAGHKAD